VVNEEKIIGGQDECTSDHDTIDDQSPHGHEVILSQPPAPKPDKSTYPKNDQSFKLQLLFLAHHIDEKPLGIHGKSLLCYRSGNFVFSKFASYTAANPSRVGSPKMRYTAFVSPIGIFLTKTHSAIQTLNALSHTPVGNTLTFLQADVMTPYKYDSYNFTVAKRLQGEIYASQQLFHSSRTLDACT